MNNFQCSQEFIDEENMNDKFVYIISSFCGNFHCEPFSSVNVRALRNYRLGWLVNLIYVRETHVPQDSSIVRSLALVRICLWLLALCTHVLFFHISHCSIITIRVCFTLAVPMREISCSVLAATKDCNKLRI